MGDANLVRSRDLGEHFERKFFECNYYNYYFYFLLFIHNASILSVIDLLSYSKSVNTPF